jgi:hypothetical protein
MLTGTYKRTHYLGSHITSKYHSLLRRLSSSWTYRQDLSCFSVDGERWSPRVYQRAPRKSSGSLRKLTGFPSCRTGNSQCYTDSGHLNWAQVSTWSGYNTRRSQSGLVLIVVLTVLLLTLSVYFRKNVLVSSTKRAVLTDFGISRISLPLSDTTRHPMCPGSPYWMAPELILQENVLPTRESDIWAFACTCYEVLTTTFFLSNFESNKGGTRS